MITGGNIFAVFAVLTWPAVSACLFLKLPRNSAILWTVLGGLLFLPAYFQIKISMVPAFDKSSVPNICILIASFVVGRKANRTRSNFGVIELLLFSSIAGPLVTSLLNSDPIVVGNSVIPGVGTYDGISAAIAAFIALIPFFVARRWLSGAADLAEILRVLATAGLIYSLPMLFEIRFSPQLAKWIYGSDGFGFTNEMRYGGFRPVVFMNNGLMTAFFMATSCLALVAMWRITRPGQKTPFHLLSAYSFAIVLLSKSAGALIYSASIGLIVRFAGSKTQIRIALLLATLTILYPVLRVTHLFPTDAVVSLARTVSEERSRSLKFRFDQEELLLQRGSERMLFGWGRYGRNRVYNEWSGDDASVTDGWWIIVLGQYGLIGFFTQFGLLVLPIYRIARVIELTGSPKDRLVTSTLALLIAITAVEQLPNASINSWTWLLVGAALGRVEILRGRINDRPIDQKTGRLVTAGSPLMPKRIR